MLPDPVSIREAASKNYADDQFKDPCILENTAHVDFDDKNLDTFGFVKVNSMPAVREHLTLKLYIDQAIFYNVNESSLLGLHPDE